MGTITTFYDKNSREIRKVYGYCGKEALYQLTEEELETFRTACLTLYEGKIDKNGEEIVKRKEIQNLDNFGRFIERNGFKLKEIFKEDNTYNATDEELRRDKPITPRDLFKIAEENGLLDSPSRLIYFPNPEDAPTPNVPLFKSDVCIKDDFIEFSF